MKILNEKLFLSALLVVAMACNNNTNKEDSVDSANDMNDKKDTSGVMAPSADTMATTPVDKDVADFAVEAANGGMMEVELGKVAQQKAESQRIKDFGAMMVQDHSAANDKLKSLAQSKNITLPGTIGIDAQKDIDDLNKKTGRDFDKAFMSMMLSDHKKDVKAFQKAASDLKDMDVRNFAAETLPTLQKHLDSAMAITGKK